MQMWASGDVPGSVLQGLRSRSAAKSLPCGVFNSVDSVERFPRLSCAPRVTLASWP